MNTSHLRIDPRDSADDLDLVEVYRLRRRLTTYADELHNWAMAEPDVALMRRMVEREAVVRKSVAASFDAVAARQAAGAVRLLRLAVESHRLD